MRLPLRPHQVMSLLAQIALEAAARLDVWQPTPIDQARGQHRLAWLEPQALPAGGRGELIMKRVFKYPFLVEGAFEIALPAGAEVLSVQVQRETPCIWALISTEEPAVPRRFRLVGTGQPVDFAGRFIGTFQLASGALVFHLFEIPQGEGRPT